MDISTTPITHDGLNPQLRHYYNTRDKKVNEIAFQYGLESIIKYMSVGQKTEMLQIKVHKDEIGTFINLLKDCRCLKHI